MSVISIQLLIFLSTILLIVYSYFKNRYKYWQKQNIYTIPPSIPFGNAAASLPKGFSIGVRNKTFYDEIKRKGHKFGGVFLITEPNLVITDPDLIKDVLCKDYQFFIDRGFYFNQKDDPISANLFTIDGADWRRLRTKVTPTFTSSKMKTMFHTMVEVSQNMIEFVQNGPMKDLEIKEITGKCTTDVIGACAFGIECNSFKYPNAAFRQMGKKIFHFDLWRKIQALIIVNLPKLALKMGFTPNNKEVRDFFMNVVRDSIELRKKTDSQRNDFLQLLLDLQDTMNYSFEEIVAQVFLFFMAGFETSSTAMSFGLYELAKNQDIQNKLRAEVETVLQKHNNVFTYEALSEMVYLKQVMEETLRLWPPGLTLNRRCTDDYKIPETDMVLKKGTPILISVYGVHMDPEYYPNPEIFDPDRFTDAEKAKRHSAVFLTFGDGPRNCIGKRFGMMQTRIGIANLIRNFRLTVSEKTGDLVLDTEKFLLSTVNTVYLNAEKL